MVVGGVFAVIPDGERQNGSGGWRDVLPRMRAASTAAARVCKPALPCGQAGQVAMMVLCMGLFFCGEPPVRVTVGRWDGLFFAADLFKGAVFVR